MWQIVVGSRNALWFLMLMTEGQHSENPYWRPRLLSWSQPPLLCPFYSSLLSFPLPDLSYIGGCALGFLKVKFIFLLLTIFDSI